MVVLAPVKATKYHWMSTSAGDIHDHAVFVGVDHNGGNLYVGRALLEGDLLPCKVAPTQFCAFVSYGGYEHSRFDYELLVLDCAEVEWVAAVDGEVPEGALPVGLTEQGEKLYSARVTHHGIVIPGKLHPSHGRCYIPYAGAEHGYSEYEVLVIR